MRGTITFTAPDGQSVAFGVEQVRGMTTLAATLTIELGWAVDVAAVAAVIVGAVQRGRLPEEFALGDRRVRRELLRRLREYRARGQQPPRLGGSDAVSGRLIRRAAIQAANFLRPREFTSPRDRS